MAAAAVNGAHADRLDAAAILAAMPAPDRLRIGNIEVLQEIGSTNAELLRRAATATGNTVLLAESQSHGRGRRGRHWHSEPGAGLYFSLLRRTAPGARVPAAIGLVAGVACAEALRAAGFADIGVKWPNDLLARGAKLGGILIEAAGDAIVIGIGLNVRLPAAAAAHIDQTWIDLATLADPPPRNLLAARLLSHLLETLERFEIDGLAPLRSRWLALDVLAGRRVSVVSGTDTICGTARGIAPDGGLRLVPDDAGHERVLHSADVSLRPA